MMRDRIVACAIKLALFLVPRVHGVKVRLGVAVPLVLERQRIALTLTDFSWSRALKPSHSLGNRLCFSFSIKGFFFGVHELVEQHIERIWAAVHAGLGAARALGLDGLEALRRPDSENMLRLWARGLRRWPPTRG
eukprot:Amastigsp_a177987_26.p2 type:complete len:135 gc:universal Amastigsp_a177987_26:625-1029(+)